MDTITHSLAGALIAHALGSQNTQDSRHTRIRVLCGAIAAAFPDIDYLTALINPLVFITYWHRGVTHSFVMLPLWAFLLGVTMALILRRFKQWRSFVFLSATVLSSHILLDMITSWDTQIFAPLSDYRVSLQYAFVIDPLLSTIIIIALLLALYFRARWIAIAGAGVLALYIATLAALHQQAVEIARNHARTQGLKHVQAIALPQPFSPFNWKLAISDEEGHRLTFVNLVKRKQCSPTSNRNTNIFAIRKFYCPKQQLTWEYYPRFGDEAVAKIVWEHPDFSLFRKFALLPAIYKVDNTATEVCIWFMDLRFYIPTLNTPFRYGMCKPHTGKTWRLYQIKLYSSSERQFVSVPRFIFNKSLY